jgi:DNA recombination protein RmuC
MTELLAALAGLVVGAALAYAFAVARSSSRTEAVANKRADERESRVRDEAERRIADLKDQHAALRDQFKAMATEVLEQSSKSLLLTADERFKRAHEAQDAELAKREQAVKQLVEPMAKALDEVKRQTSEAEKARAEGQATLREQVVQMVAASDKLDRKTTDFINTLRRSDVRGNWGEVQLRRVVELSGMVNYVDFTEQDNVQDEGRNLRPDMVVHLAGGRSVVVDSKVALVALIEAFETDDEAVRAERLLAHARHVKKHVDDLSSKKYWEQFSPTPEFVVMFVPSEAFYQAALEQDPALQEYAFSKNIVIATPTTLVAMLRTVAHAWKEAALADNARDVLNAGQDLHKRLLTMGEHFAKLGRALDSAGKAYDGVVGSYERSVLPGSRRLAELKVIDAPLEAPETLDLHPRSPKEIEAGELSPDPTA